MKNELNLKQIINSMIQACQEGRTILLNYFGHLKHVEEKLHQGLVSEADKESEKAIFQSLKINFPNFEFLGEESAYLNNEELVKKSSNPRWILDPLDGTTNYIHQFPIFCISLALEVNSEIVAAVIDVPLLNETYTAIKGGGSFVNGVKMSVSKSNRIEDTLLATGFFPDDIPNLEEQLKIFSTIVRKSRGVRRPGAAAYDMAQVARGVFDGFWEKNLKPWDSAAGLLLIREAGGIVKNYTGKDYSPFDNSLICGNSKIVDLLLCEIQNCK